MHPAMERVKPLTKAECSHTQASSLSSEGAQIDPPLPPQPLPTTDTLPLVYTLPAPQTAHEVGVVTDLQMWKQRLGEQ